MPITRVRFGLPESSPPTPGGEDVHVLRGQSTLALRDRVFVADARERWRSFDDFAAAHPNEVAIEFRPVFRATDAGAEYRGFGIHVDKTTGEVRVDPGAAPDPSPSNFIVEAVVVHNQGGAAAQSIEPAALRVHVHVGVLGIALAPQVLTVRRPTGPDRVHSRYAFTIHARFDDGVVGDVTFSHELQRFQHPRYFWLHQAGETHRIAVPAAATLPQEVDVTVTTSPGWGSKSATGRIRFEPAWDHAANLPGIEWIDGNARVLDGTVHPERFPNVLLMGCGFPDGSRTSFERLTQVIVHHLGTDRMLQPYGALATSMNYWRLFVPGQAGGVSIRGEVSWFERGGTRFATLVPAAAPPNGTVPWELQHLIYMAGLPLPADIARVREQSSGRRLATVEDVRGLAEDEIDFNDLVQKWNAITRPVPAGSVAPDVAREWLLLANRTLLDEIDTFPALSVGTPPCARFDDDGRLAFHDLRGGIDECRAFLCQLGAMAAPGRPPIVLAADVVSEDDAPGTALGQLWGLELPNVPAFDNRRFLVAVGNVPLGRAFWSEGQAARVRVFPSAEGLLPDPTDVDYPGVPIAANAAGNGFTPLVPDAGAKPLADTWRVLAHEVAHAFGLGDEYARHAASFTGDEGDLDDYANLTTPDAVVDANGAFAVDRIKWNWHRILFAAVLTGPVRSVGGRFAVPIPIDPSLRIGPQNIVFLRERDPQVVIGRDPTSAGPFQVANVDPTTGVATLVPLVSVAHVDFDAFFPNGILYMPVPGANSGELYRLIPPAAVRIMRAIGGSMTGLVCHAGDQVNDGGTFTQVPVHGDPDGKVRHKDLPGLVGAYFGGKQLACGILHPTGQCMMRNSHRRSARFCPVCRYVLVDQIDPGQHGRIDREYAKRFAR